MSKVYIEHDDHHNSAMMQTYDSEEDAITVIANAEGVEGKAVWDELFDPEDGTGEYIGLDRWTLIDAEDADRLSKHWAAVAQAIRDDVESPY